VFRGEKKKREEDSIVCRHDEDMMDFEFLERERVRIIF